MGVRLTARTTIIVYIGNLGVAFDQEEIIMGKAHESAKEPKKQAQQTLKDKKTAKRDTKPAPGSPPFMGHHYQSEASQS